MLVHVRETGEMKDEKDKRFITHGLHSSSMSVEQYC